MINWGFMGTSEIAYTMARAVNQSVHSRLYAVAGRTAHKLEAISNAFRFSKQYTDYHELLSDPAIDVVYISLPNHCHAEWIKKTAMANKAILCEKSICYDYRQSQSALTMVDNQRVFCMEGLMYRCHPYIDTLMELIDTQRIGELLHIDAYYSANIHQQANPDGGGVVLNLGCYPLSLLQLIIKQTLGEFSFNQIQFTSQGRVARNNIRRAQALFNINDAVTASISVADDLPMSWNFSVVGSEGSITAINNPWMPQSGKNQWLLTDQEGRQKIINSASEADAYCYQIQMVESCLREKRIEAKDHAPKCMDSLQIMQVLDEWRGQILTPQKVI